jgi:predicted DNA-binding ribbon-helix-helix protein
MAELHESVVDRDDSKSSLVSRNITILGRRTSIRLEPEMWMALREIAKRERCSIHDICSLVSVRKNQDTSLTAAIRVFLMLYFRAATTEDGHVRAGHGNFDFMKKRARVAEDQIKTMPQNASSSILGPYGVARPIGGVPQQDQRLRP